MRCLYSALDHVGDEVLVLRLQLLGVLKDVLGILVGHLFSVVSGVFDLFYLLHALELDEEDDGVDLVLVEPLHRPKMNVEDAMLIPVAYLSYGGHSGALVMRAPTLEVDK